MDHIEAVQKRPGMYIGDTSDGSGLHGMVEEVVGNSINEALAGFGDRLDIVLNADGSVTIRDNGRGIPTDIHPTEGISAAEVIMTRLYAPGRFTEPTRQTCGIRGVGVVVVNALSEWLHLRIWRNGKEHGVRFRHGRPEAPLSIVGDAEIIDGRPARGTEITFHPNAQVFTPSEFDLTRIEQRLRKLPVFKAGVTVVLSDQRGVDNNEIMLRL